MQIEKCIEKERRDAHELQHGDASREGRRELYKKSFEGDFHWTYILFP